MTMLTAETLLADLLRSAREIENLVLSDESRLDAWGSDLEALSAAIIAAEQYLIGITLPTSPSPKILIIVNGGTVESVRSTSPLSSDVEVLDRDVMREGAADDIALYIADHRAEGHLTKDLAVNIEKYPYVLY